jgi:hypothetical protein
MGDRDVFPTVLNGREKKGSINQRESIVDDQHQPAQAARNANNLWYWQGSKNKIPHVIVSVRSFVVYLYVVRISFGVGKRMKDGKILPPLKHISSRRANLGFGRRRRKRGAFSGGGSIPKRVAETGAFRRRLQRRRQQGWGRVLLLFVLLLLLLLLLLMRV